MRERVTISVPEALLRRAERIGKDRGLRTRSAVVVNALELLVRDSRSSEVDAELDAYYQGRSPTERAEERKLVKAFQRSRRRLDLDREGK
jgi:metal-responsive CopG/Arc/MetJ family transcriptional regulator